MITEGGAMGKGQADNWQVQLALTALKEATDKGSFTFLPRKKNMDFLAKNGWSIDDVKRAIRALSLQDYDSGPEADRDIPGSDENIWKFNTQYLGKEIHIKVKLIIRRGDHYVICMSFHD